MFEPTPAQCAVRNATESALLVLAPAGCGKTEALALRVAGLLERGQVLPPRVVLVATFTNRARDNIRERLAAHVRPGDLRDRVKVHNFHGLAARIVKAHADVIGVDPELALPDRDWVGDQIRSRKLDYNQAARIKDALREVNQQGLRDEQVLKALAREPMALAIEQQRQNEHRLAYDDLPRLAELILQDDTVADLYQNHFAYVVVDEFQDLTPQQLRIVQRIGYGRTTYAGDLAQGIYRFAGAAPKEIAASLRSEVERTITFTESHRSSPAVLAMVNALSEAAYGQTLTSAAPASWPGGGVAAGVAFGDVRAEAEWVLAVAQFILAAAPNQRIAVITRANGRRRFIDEAVHDTDAAYYRWDDPVLDAQTAAIVKAMLNRLDVVTLKEVNDQLAYLWNLAQGEGVQDPSTREYLTDALGWVIDLVDDGCTPADVRARIVIGDGDTLLTRPGIHLLNGHVGKGQQFDWVFVVGLEDGCLPDFRSTTPEAYDEELRVLSVMISRARHGVVLTWSGSVPAWSGVAYSKNPSSFLRYFDDVSAFCGHEAFTAWLEAADWSAIQKR